MIKPLQKGSTAVIEFDLTDPKTKKAIDPAKSVVKLLLRKPGASSEAELTVPTPTNGHYEVPVDLDTAGKWKGHLVVTGDYKKKLPISFEVGDD